VDWFLFFWLWLWPWTGSVDAVTAPAAEQCVSGASCEAEEITVAERPRNPRVHEDCFCRESEEVLVPR
jgi:hypothetical protein